VAFDDVESINRRRVAALKLPVDTVPCLDRCQIAYVLNFDFESILL